MSDIELLALHGLAVKKAGGPAAVAVVVDRDEAELEPVLQRAVEAGRAAGAKGTFMVTPAGRAWLLEQYPEAYAAFRADPAADDAYARFERINRRLLALFTDWQMTDAAGGRVANDHSDPEYDRRIVDRLGDQHERAARVLEDLAALEGRLAAYGRRLDTAYDRVLAGEHEYVSGVRIDSYHTVWFELHEDLLRMLGREREEAP
ncbi:MAG: hypothetical protein JWO02_73 [Solirubrobacterales bacterium]|nr:hypothetical protein [Solirubrobacterales bacterium]